MQEHQSSQRLVAGRYRMRTILGRGGAGLVWEATDELIGRSVAIKELRPPPELTADERTQLTQRALREARAAGQVRHPAVVTIHDVVPATPEDEAVYLVMELVDAPTLAEILASGKALSEKQVATLGVQLLDALSAAHAIGVVHRDVKPANIMMLPDGTAKLVDFSIAHRTHDTRLTRHGVMGSTGYLAPELFHGQDPTPATDMWSVGATLFHAAQGHGPFERGSTAATMHAVLYEELPSTPGPLSDVISGLLTRDPTQRMTGDQAKALLLPVSNGEHKASVSTGEPKTSVEHTPPEGAPPGPSSWETKPTAAQAWETKPTTQQPVATKPVKPSPPAPATPDKKSPFANRAVVFTTIGVVAITAFVGLGIGLPDAGRYPYNVSACSLVPYAEGVQIWPDAGFNTKTELDDTTGGTSICQVDTSRDPGITIEASHFTRGFLSGAPGQAQDYLETLVRNSTSVGPFPEVDADESFTGFDTAHGRAYIAFRISNLVVVIKDQKETSGAAENARLGPWALLARKNFPTPGQGS